MSSVIWPSGRECGSVNRKAKYEFTIKIKGHRRVRQGTRVGGCSPSSPRRTKTVVIRTKTNFFRAEAAAKNLKNAFIKRTKTSFHSV